MIVKADDGFVPRDGQSALAQARHNARRQDIRGGENAGDFRLFAQLAAQPPALLHGNLLGVDQRRVKCNAVFRQRTAIAPQALVNHAPGLYAGRRKGNGAMPVFQQMPGGNVAPLLVLQPDAADIRIVHIAVNQHQRDAELFHRLKEVALEQAGKDQPGEAPAVDEGGQRIRRLRGADHQIVSLITGALLNAGHNGAHEGVVDGAARVLRGDVRHHADDVRLIVGKGPRSHAGHIVFPLDDLPYFPDLLGRHAALSVMHHVGYRGDADAGLCGNVLQCDHSYLQ